MDAPVSAKAALLQALLDGESYGAELIARVKHRSAGKFILGMGSVYPALRDMEHEGLLKVSAEETTTRGGRPRIYYRLTAAGRRLAEEHRQVVRALFADGG